MSKSPCPSFNTRVNCPVVNPPWWSLLIAAGVIIAAGVAIWACCCRQRAQRENTPRTTLSNNESTFVRMEHDTTQSPAEYSPAFRHDSTL